MKLGFGLPVFLFLTFPAGALLFCSGFLSFMLTGSISVIRFGMILRGALLASHILSLRAWKEGKSTATFLKGQAGIVGLLYLRDICLLYQGLSLGTILMALISGLVVTF